MSSPKFKIKDRIYCYQRGFENFGVIKDVYPFSRNEYLYDIRFDGEKFTTANVSEKCLVDEEIWNSPLYKAMKENE